MSAKELPDQLILHFQARFPFLLGQRLLVALSGGADSVALLHLLQQPVLGLELEAAHVHHGVRGAEADADADCCDELCRRLGLPFHLLHLDPAAATPEGREGGWRRQRYELLAGLAEQRRAAAVATGHHRDDVAEGVLVQLLRGTGPRGLAGIAAWTATGVVRPLLPWSRRCLEAWLVARGISWREDSSNREPSHLRNRVRHQLLPELERHAPGLRTHLVRLAAALAEDEAYLAGELARQASWIDPWHPDGGVPVQQVRDLAPALRSRWLHSQAARAGIGKVSRRHLALLHRLLDQGEPRAITLGGRWRLRLVAARLWLEPPSPPSPYAFALVLDDPPWLPVPWTFRALPAATVAEPPWQRVLPGHGRLTIRSPRAGDTLDRGAGVSTTLSRLLAEQLPRHLRRAWPVVCVDGTIDWIPGVWHRAAPGRAGGTVVEVKRR